jgi:type II secretory pathway pseudopilin PulG
MKFNDSRGFSLVEVTLALGLVAFALISLLGLLPVGLNTVRESSDQRDGMNILSALDADIRNVPSGKTDSQIYGIPVWLDNGTVPPKYLNQNGHVVPTKGEAFYQVTWTIYRPAANSADPLRIYLRVSWPGKAANPTGSLESLVVIAKQGS